MLSLGFSVEISANKMFCKTGQIVSECEIGAKVNDFINIDTDISTSHWDHIVTILRGYSNNFFKVVPTGHVRTGNNFKSGDCFVRGSGAKWGRVGS